MRQFPFCFWNAPPWKALRRRNAQRIFKWGAGACLSEFASCPGLSVLRCACDPNETICASQPHQQQHKNTMLGALFVLRHRHTAHTALWAPPRRLRSVLRSRRNHLFWQTPHLRYRCAFCLFLHISPAGYIHAYICVGWSGDKLHDIPMNNWAWCCREAVPPSESWEIRAAVNAIYIEMRK